MGINLFTGSEALIKRPDISETQDHLLNLSLVLIEIMLYLLNIISGFVLLGSVLFEAGIQSELSDKYDQFSVQWLSDQPLQASQLDDKSFKNADLTVFSLELDDNYLFINSNSTQSDTRFHIRNNGAGNHGYPICYYLLLSEIDLPPPLLV